MAIPNHMLQLIAMHREGPGSLDVVFGRDGDFEAAPYWVGPVTDIDPSGVGGIYHVAAVLSGESIATIEGAGNNLPLYSVALDLRVPSVAARLAGLCARALDAEATGQAWTTEAGEIRPEFWVVRYCDTAGYAASVAWCKATGRPDRRGLSPCPPETPSLPSGLADVPSFLAALTLVLAPKIAALGGV